MNREISKDEAVYSALKSTQMEGFRITPKIEADCRRIVNGELSVAEYIQQIKTGFQCKGEIAHDSN